jgi:HTH-type transcriptional regulator/antitoxin HigA
MRRRDSYLLLIKRFPLRPLRNERDLDQAIAIVNQLLDQERLDAGARDYLDVLGDLVENYEEEHHPIPQPTDADMLAYLLDLKDLRQAQLAAKTGIATSTISEVLSGKRLLTRGQIEKLSAFFGVEPAVFLGTG